MDIIIFGGQSNMQGQTEGCPVPNDAIEHAWEYHYQADTLKTLCHPVGENIGDEPLLARSSNDGGSLIPSFCHAYVKNTGHECVAVHAARGSTTIAEWQEDTARFACASNKIQAAIRKVSAEYPIENVYYVWLQGESNAVAMTTSEEYTSQLIAYKNALKKRFPIQKFALIKVGYFFSESTYHRYVALGSPEQRQRYDEQIMEAQENVVKADSDFVMLTRICPSISRDSKYMNPLASGHYNNMAMDIIGAEAGTALAKITKGETL